MDKLVKEAMATNTGDEDLHRLTEGKCNIMRYAELRNYPSLQAAAAPYGACICLFETEPRKGHWIAFFESCAKEGKNTWEWFDSYGLRPDDELAFVTPEVEEETKQGNLISDLIARANKEVRMIYNQAHLQSPKDNVDDCGRWCALRIRKRGFTLAEFQELFVDQSQPPDFWATVLTLL